MAVALEGLMDEVLLAALSHTDLYELTQLRFSSNAVNEFFEKHKHRVCATAHEVYLNRTRTTDPSQLICNVKSTRTGQFVTYRRPDLLGFKKVHSYKIFVELGTYGLHCAQFIPENYLFCQELHFGSVENIYLKVREVLLHRICGYKKVFFATASSWCLQLLPERVEQVHVAGVLRWHLPNYIPLKRFKRISVSSFLHPIPLEKQEAKEIFMTFVKSFVDDGPGNVEHMELPGFGRCPEVLDEDQTATKVLSLDDSFPPDNIYLVQLPNQKTLVVHYDRWFLEIDVVSTSDVIEKVLAHLEVIIMTKVIRGRKIPVPDLSTLRHQMESTEMEDWKECISSCITTLVAFYG